MKHYGIILLWLGYAVGIGVWVFRGLVGWWLLGVGLAVGLWWMDRLLYVWWLKPFEQLSVQVQYWWKQKDYRAVIRLLGERGGEQTKLMLRSAGFAILWPFLALYVMTSTGSITAIGMIMGLGFSLALVLIRGWKEPQVLGKWFCWQIKRSVSEKEVRILVGVYLGVWLLIQGLLMLR